ncbi:protein naked cuticle homolog [Anopheles nili]|uniref:protein naked cuticle homolog n=1 Tax=Anopheles nili TaxID=185578 RepID=UPI00237A46EB|nr:protein naked cuticle homolog [Anopheles nili]
MAGNIVKWWKHKILGGYKQFTVLQECATDSEELIYPGRAPSACSAPPDLLLTSDREQMLKVKSSSSSTGAGTGQTKSTAQQHVHHHHHGQQQQHHHQPPAGNGHNHSIVASQQQQQQQHHHKSQKDGFRKCASAGKAGGSGGGGGATNTINTTAATIRSDPDRVRLEEFTCDVSLEDGKKPQPLQFSFTLYDLDGHGKITKDDIAGIVSTIYESIGKSVVVPHYGSKTINVRLTVSPDGKTSAATKTAATKKAIITPRRRYRARKLISDDDGSDTSENCPRLLRNRTAAGNTGAGATSNNQTVAQTQQQQQQQHHHHHHSKVKESNLSKAAALAAEDGQANRSLGLSNSSEGSSAAGQLLVEAYHNNLSPTVTLKGSPLNNATTVATVTGKPRENVYESINNLKCCNLQQSKQQPVANNTSQTAVSPLSVATGLNQSTASTAALLCHDCIDGAPATTATLLPTLETVVLPAAVATGAGAFGRSKRKLVRKTRSSRKPATGKLTADDFAGRPRARSLSVGNENCYENVIGRMAAAQEECWKSSLCRRELIEIIRESMVKNSLCFQPNRKAMESSPKHRYRSHTIASRVGDQVFLNYHHPATAALMAANNGAVTVAAEMGGGAQATTTTTTTTALVAMAAGHETNLCGYDSYLHKTICAGGAGGGTAAAVHLINGGVQALATSTPNRLLQHHLHQSKAKRKEHHRTVAAAAGATVRTTQHPTPVKLSTALLNQQYPNLSAEQKLTRSINQVEQWLDHRSPKLLPKMKLSEELRTAVGRQLKRSSSKEELAAHHGNLLLLDNLKISEDIAEIAVVTPKKVFNKESLIASATKKNIKTHHQQTRQPTVGSAPAAVAVGGEKPVSPVAGNTAIPNGGSTPQVVQLQYGSVPVNADPSECENLIRMSDDGEEEAQQPTTGVAVRHHHRHHQQQSRSQPQSPQHHQHHFQQQQPGQQQRYCGSGGAHSVSSASAASTTAVHRYVHEHIHHHYHHFENDPDES